MKYLIFCTILFIIILSGCTQKNINDELNINDTIIVSDTLTVDTVTTYNPMDEINLETVYFKYNSYDLNAIPSTRESIQRNAMELNKYPSVNIRLEGHCDERGTNEYNLALGQKRADICRTYLINYGIAPQRILTISYGEEKPDVFGNDENSWGKNRRVEFKIVRE